MSIMLGDIDVANEIIDLHFQLRKTQILLDLLIQRSSAMIHQPTAIGAVISNPYSTFSNPLITIADVQQAEQTSLSFVQTKYPNMGIQKKL